MSTAALDEALMARAIGLAERAQLAGEPPFGALIVNARGELVSQAADEVQAGRDFSLHAEVSAVRRACRAVGPSLEGHTLYTTVEPCPMCFTAAWLARVERIVFGASMAQVKEATRGAQRELLVEAARMNELSGQPLQLRAGVLAERCLALFGAGRPALAAERDAALLLIDFQRDFCEIGGYADRLFGSAWAREVLPQAGQLLAAARQLGLFIVHTREGYAADLSDCAEQRQQRSQRAGAAIGAAGPLGRFLIRGEPGHDFVPELMPLPGELVIDKATYGAFTRTELEQELRARGIRHLYFAGVTADVCVHTTLREATDRGFFCHYVRDAISTFDPELRRACETMVEVEGGIWGELTDSARAIQELRDA
jgi:nicotinamidase-related amidase/tRNA(Arg) A34 adenosine deaminase TadA